MALPCLLHQYLQGEQLIGIAMPLPETTLAFAKEQLSSGLESIENGFGKHLTWYARERNTMVVGANGTTSFLVQWHKDLTLSILTD